MILSPLSYGLPMPFARLLFPLRRLSAVLLALSLAACVGNVSGAPVERMLAGRTVIFGEAGSTKDDSFWQDWSADGTTRTGGPSVFHDKTGRWKVENGTYCEMFGASTEWTCWRITLSDHGRQIRFWEIPGDVGDLLIFHKDMEGFFAP
jgi:hypothetical protein